MAHPSLAPKVSLRAGPAVRRAFRAALARWFAAAGRDLPWRRTHDPYAVFVSEMMLQQTQVTTVVPYFLRWLTRFPTVQSLAAADGAEVLSGWQGLGYYARARHLHRAAQWVMEHGGEMPRDLAELRALPGAGRYTAGAIASFAYDQPAAAVDANIGRVLARLLDLREPIDTTAGREALWAAAELLLPRAGGRLHNSALMELGALVCLPRKPLCPVCPVRRYCLAAEPGSLPVKKAPRATVAVEENCAWIWHRGRVLLEQQTGTRWAGLWKLPRRAELTKEAPLRTAVYPFTHHRITLRVYRGERREPRPGEAWFTEEEARTAALPSPHRRALTALWHAEKAPGSANE